MKEKNHYYNPLINEVLKDKEKIEKGSRIIEKKPRNNLCYTFYGQFSGFYVPDPCELSFANTLLLSNAAISLGNAFISLEISSSSFIFFSLFSFILGWERAYFTGVTILISLPTGTKIFNWLSTYLGNPPLLQLKTSSAFFGLLFLLMFTIGGSTGIILGLMNAFLG